MGLTVLMSDKRSFSSELATIFSGVEALVGKRAGLAILRDARLDLLSALEELEKGLEDGDKKVAATYLHTLLGVLMTFGFLRAGNICRHLLDGDCENTSDIASLRQEILLISIALQNLDLHELGAAS